MSVKGENGDCGQEKTELMKLINVYLPLTCISLLDEVVEEGFYSNRAEAIRLSIRTLLSEHNKFSAKTSYKSPSKSKLAAVEKLVKMQSRRIRFLRAETNR